MYFKTFFRIFLPKQVPENLTPFNSRDSRKVAVLENDRTGDYIYPDGFTSNSSHWLFCS